MQQVNNGRDDPGGLIATQTARSAICMYRLAKIFARPRTWRRRPLLEIRAVVPAISTLCGVIITIAGCTGPESDGSGTAGSRLPFRPRLPFLRRHKSPAPRMTGWTRYASLGNFMTAQAFRGATGGGNCSARGRNGFVFITQWDNDLRCGMPSWPIHMTYYASSMIDDQTTTVFSVNGRDPSPLQPLTSFGFTIEPFDQSVMPPAQQTPPVNTAWVPSPRIAPTAQPYPGPAPTASNGVQQIPPGTDAQGFVTIPPLDAIPGARQR